MSPLCLMAPSLIRHSINVVDRLADCLTKNGISPPRASVLHCLYLLLHVKWCHQHGIIFLKCTSGLIREVKNPKLFGGIGPISCHIISSRTSVMSYRGRNLLN